MGSLTPWGISAGSTVALDTPVFVYFLEHHPRYYAAARELFHRIETGDLAGTVSSLVFAELLVPAYRADDPRRAGTILTLVTGFPHLRVLDVSPKIAAHAAELRARHGLRTPNAIHGATALAAKADALVTNERDLLKLGEHLAVRRFEDLEGEGRN